MERAFETTHVCGSQAMHIIYAIPANDVANL